MTPIETYAVKLVAEGAESYAEDDIDDNGELDGTDDLRAAIKLACEVAQWVGEHPEDVLNLVREGTLA